MARVSNAVTQSYQDSSVPNTMQGRDGGDKDRDLLSARLLELRTEELTLHRALPGGERLDSMNRARRKVREASLGSLPSDGMPLHAETAHLSWFFAHAFGQSCASLRATMLVDVATYRPGF